MRKESWSLAWQPNATNIVNAARTPRTTVLVDANLIFSQINLIRYKKYIDLSA